MYQASEIIKTIANFDSDYLKLNQNCFTTIRDTNYLKRHDLTFGDIGFITYKRDKMMVGKIIHIEIMKLEDIPLKILQDDTKTPNGMKVFTHKLFEIYFNSESRRKIKSQKSELLIIYIEKIANCEYMNPQAKISSFF